jgi:Rrf2 family protein
MVIANGGDGPVSSDFIASSVGTNPVLIRRLMGDLREAGLVASKAGPTGGFVLARPVGEITLDRIYGAVAQEELFPRHDHPNLQCPIGRTIGTVLDKIYGGAESAVRDSLRRLCLSDLVYGAETAAAE